MWASGVDKMGGVQKDVVMYDRRRYGGSAEASEAELGRAKQGAATWDSRYGQQFGGPIDYAQADASRAQGQQARSEQLYGQNLAQRVAQGQGPSAAGAQFGADLDATAQAQAAAMAGGNIRAAQLGGQQSMAQIGGAYGRGVAGETDAGRRTYMGGAGALRQDDLGQAGMDMQRQQANADMFYRQRGLGDQMNSFYEKLGYGVNAANMDAEHQGNELALQEYAQRGAQQLGAAERGDAAMAGAAQGMATAAAVASDRRVKRDVSPLSRTYGGG